MTAPFTRSPRRTLGPLLGTSALIAFVAGCQGLIGSQSGGVVRGDAGPAVCSTAIDPGAPYMRRLTNSEYDRTMRDLVGATGSPSADFPDTPYKSGFNNNVDQLHISPVQAEHYLDAAEQMTADVMADPVRRARVLGCDPTDTATRATCVQSFVVNFGRLAFRRPLAEDEVAQYVALAGRASGSGAFAGVSLVLEAMLQSPNTLFRIESGTPDSTHPGFNRLTGLEMAARLSYLLWSSTPDDALLATAEAGGLDTLEGVAQTARTMLSDPRAREAMHEFYGQWLRLYDLDQAAPNPEFTPWNDGLRAAMVEENRLFVDDFIWTDGANFLDLLTARYTYVNPSLASLYRLPALPSGTAWARAVFADHTERGGLLTQGAFLAGHARPDSDSPTRRGKYIREVLLCQEMPAPPPDVPPLAPTLPGQTQRQRLEEHRTNPACSGCHTMMDPVGLGLERYDAIGRLQTEDPSGAALTGEGELIGFMPPEFTGPIELGRRLRDAPQLPDCIVTHTFRYAFGRTTGDGDTCALAQIGQTFRAANYSFRDMIVALVTSDSFRYVHPGAPEAGGGL